MEAQTIAMDDDNRRRERRVRCYRGGRVVFNSGYAVFDCIIRNLSSGGALIEMESLLGIPTYFELHKGPGEPPVRCEVRWRDGKRMGVLFLTQQ
ncbi:MAG TPA: PilZ domain-containing protein [Bauldia sp.]|nr:PilZ domain-containing protein [Bauldia sp.]